jgi:hypothetical protein
MPSLFDFWLLFLPLVLGFIFVAELTKKRRMISALESDGFNQIFHGGGTSFIAFNIHKGVFRFGRLDQGDFLERPIAYISDYEWKWIERGGIKTSNRYFFYISDVDHFMHEVFYGDKARQAEMEWAKLKTVYQASVSIQYAGVSNMARTNNYDFFISHASEDKDDFVRPLVQALITLGLKVWYDELTLEVGDSLRRNIDHGLGNSRYGIVILSKAFFAKQWPQYELDALVNKSMAGKKVILPIWYGVQHTDVSEFSHSLADKVAFSASILSINEMALELLKLIQRNDF